jgi:hypothetical protein
VTLAGYHLATAVGLSYLAAHVVLYFSVLRNLRFFQSELGIFLYHLGSVTVLTVAALAIALVHFSDAALAVAIGLIAIHCIYSISFLELWSLAEGSYSMSIITGIAAKGKVSRNALIDAFASIGDAKKANRLSVLSQTSLAQRKGSYWQISARGRLLAHALDLLIWLAAIKNRG